MKTIKSKINLNLLGYLAFCLLGLILTLRLMMLQPSAAPTPSNTSTASTTSMSTKRACLKPSDAIAQNTRLPSIANAFYPLAQPDGAPSAHAASGDYDQDGTLMAVWFAGTREGARSVKIYSAQFKQGQWTLPRIIADSQSTGEESGYFVKNLGNPTLIYHQHTWWLFYVGVSAGGWSGSRLYVKHSRDGVMWSKAQQLVNNAFFNLSTLVRNVPLSDGDNILLPAYHELALKNPEYLRFSPRLNRVTDRYRPAARGFLQPALVMTQSGERHAWLRASNPWQQIGLHQWAHSSAQITTEPNPNSSVAALALNNGCDLLAFNPREGRFQLLLRQWCLNPQSQGEEPTPDDRPLIVESGAENNEFSYPTLLQHGDDIDLLYTWNRQRIVLRRFARKPLLQALTNKSCD